MEPMGKVEGNAEQTRGRRSQDPDWGFAFLSFRGHCKPQNRTRYYLQLGLKAFFFFFSAVACGSIENPKP